MLPVGRAVGLVRLQRLAAELDCSEEIVERSLEALGVRPVELGTDRWVDILSLSVQLVRLTVPELRDAPLSTVQDYLAWAAGYSAAARTAALRDYLRGTVSPA